MLYIHPNALGALASLARTSVPPDFTIDGFPEYATSPDSLAADQRQVLSAAAGLIERSQYTLCPVVGALVVGHSDKALRKPVSERAQFELEVSNKRAAAAADSLKREVELRSWGAHYAKCFRAMAIGIGNARPRYVYATNELQMRQNRRVDIVLLSQVLGQPRCGTA